MSEKTGISWTDHTFNIAWGCHKVSEGCARKPHGSPLASNPNWRGGRTITQHGYVLIKLPGHPSADCRGYVYEHRLVAERALGRALLPGEVVHHRDGDKSNNDPSNLEVIASGAEHRVRHRKRTDLRLPGEPNETIPCACGCGATLARYDAGNRPRRFISGHNGRVRGGAR